MRVALDTSTREADTASSINAIAAAGSVLQGGG
jgi:hypothetical protein